MLHYGQGKWYPGEQLPRWAYAVHWRTDGVALWDNPDLIDRESPGKPVGIADAARYSAALCRSLDLPTDAPIAAYEDPGYFALVEQKLPLGVDPANNRLDDLAERARLVAVFDRGLAKPTGYVLPIQVWQSQDRRRWGTERWRFRRERLYLTPGDSAVGFRLPLHSLPPLAAMDFPSVEPADPFTPRAALPDRQSSQQRRPLAQAQAAVAHPDAVNEVIGSVRTALVVEPRDGHLCVFLPPVADAEDYAALIGALEVTAKDLDLPIRLEGYAPPPDPRLNVIKVTPDPGVIEVNIHPTTDWPSLVAVTTAIYEEARLTRLGAEKFMLDGRHTGTGGGNHIVLGGKTPADSPFLRRPDLLASVITYWQNHPSLTYLFSGMFIGPTSQAPRIDEARHDQLYEMEIALAQVSAAQGTPTPPWLVDRIFRHLLVDVTGNTHRAEICIDKLYSPDGPAGRLGLVEFRSFEMPPHARMSLAQQLLVRALIAWFWEQPYRRPLIRWGTALHDRFMLPHFIKSDFKAVIDDLQAAGLPIAADWFEPHFEFRFPMAGMVERAGLRLELRQALEPWHVLGEEGTVGGTARYVDSSLERLEVRVTGETQGRYVVTCNGYALPFTATGTFGQSVAGVRFRAWQPASVLHPTIPPHVPLTFDILDTWSGRSVGGCRYHVAHPGGRGLEVLPINAFEAEGRRIARFEAMGHTAGKTEVRAAGIHPEFPLTLDLRRVG
jgi:uncharacterized protein (DUF2126 family)